MRSATALPWCRRRDSPCYVPEGDSPLSGKRRRRRRRRKVYTGANAVKEEQEDVVAARYLRNYSENK